MAQWQLDYDRSTKDIKPNLSTFASMNEASVASMNDDTNAVAYLMGQSKDSKNDASVESMDDDTIAVDYRGQKQRPYERGFHRVHE